MSKGESCFSIAANNRRHTLPSPDVAPPPPFEARDIGCIRRLIVFQLLSVASPSSALSKAHGPPGNGHLDRREHRLELHAGEDKIITRRPSPPLSLSLSLFSASFLPFFLSFLPSPNGSRTRESRGKKKKESFGGRVSGTLLVSREKRVFGEGNCGLCMRSVRRREGGEGWLRWIGWKRGEGRFRSPSDRSSLIERWIELNRETKDFWKRNRKIG